MTSCFGHRHSRQTAICIALCATSVEDDASLAHLPMGGNAKLFADRLGQSFDDMDLIAELLRVKCGFLDAMRFRQADHIDSRDFGGISSAGKGHCVPGVVDRLRSGRNPIGVVLIALESGI